MGNAEYMGSLLRLIGRHSRQDGQGSKWGRILRGAAADVQGLLQADGHQQGWPAGQERPARSLRQRRCAHERVRARRSAGRDLWTLHLRQHGQDVPGEDGRRGQRPRRPHRPGFKAYDNEGKIDSKMFEHALKTWGDNKTKDVIGLFVSVKEEPKVEEPAPVEEVAEAEPE